MLTGERAGATAASIPAAWLLGRHLPWRPGTATTNYADLHTPAKHVVSGHRPTWCRLVWWVLQLVGQEQMMRNPLDRRMFMNPQQRRGMARMPQGILASGPRIMQAAAAQEPVRMAHGGYHGSATGTFMAQGLQPSLKSICTWSPTIRSVAHRPRTNPLVLWILHRVQTQEARQAMTSAPGCFNGNAPLKTVHKGDRRSSARKTTRTLSSRCLLTEGQMRCRQIS